MDIVIHDTPNLDNPVAVVAVPDSASDAEYSKLKRDVFELYRKARAPLLNALARLTADADALRAELAETRETLDATRRMQQVAADAGTRTVGEVVHLERELAQAQAAVESERASRRQAEADAGAIRERIKEFQQDAHLGRAYPLDRLWRVLAADHPGAALLTELAAAREVVKAAQAYFNRVGAARAPELAEALANYGYAENRGWPARVTLTIKEGVISETIRLTIDGTDYSMDEIASMVVQQLEDAAELEAARTLIADLRDGAEQQSQSHADVLAKIADFEAVVKGGPGSG